VKIVFLKNSVISDFHLLTGSPSQPIQDSLTAPIVSVKENVDFAGKIVVVPSFLLKTNLPQIRAAQSRGAVGVLATLDFLCRFNMYFKVIMIVLNSSNVYSCGGLRSVPGGW
jgi:hypothetical protein